MKDIMLDIETLGVQSNAYILAIATVEFDRHTGELGERRCYRPLMQNGRVVTPGYVMFWQAMPRLFETLGQLDGINQANWFIQHAHAIDWCWWAKGPDFDKRIMMNWLGDWLTIEPPWRDNAFRDVRTAKELVPSEHRPEIHHHPIDDCLAQIRTVVDAFGGLNG